MTHNITNTYYEICTSNTFFGNYCWTLLDYSSPDLVGFYFIISANILPKLQFFIFFIFKHGQDHCVRIFVVRDAD